MENNIILREKFDAGLKNALFANFSRYSDAILELLDNSVSNRIQNKLLKIDILTTKEKLTIIDRGGYGMDLKCLKDFFEWGKIKKRRSCDIGKFSQGGKAAMGYLGRAMNIMTSPNGEMVQYNIEDNDLYRFRLKTYNVKQIPVDFIEGRTQIEIGDLQRVFNKDVLKNIIVDTYRPLIKSGSISIRYNGEILKAESFPLDQTFKIEKISFSIRGFLVHGWIGRLLPKSGVKGGMRCYKLGRLMCDKEFFGPYDANYKQTLNYLFGEIHLDHVSAITNKTNFDRDSRDWKEIERRMFSILKPHIDDLLGRDIKEPTEEEKKRAKEARDLVAELMKMRAKDLWGAISKGEAFGQKPSEQRKEDLDTNRTVLHNRDAYQPRTSPSRDAKGKRRRLKEFIDWEVRPMDESVRSIIETDNKYKKLVINNLFPGFRAAKGHILYMIETAALQLSYPEGEDISVKEYLVEFDELYSYFCDNLDDVKKKIQKRKY